MSRRRRERCLAVPALVAFLCVMGCKERFADSSVNTSALAVDGGVAWGRELQPLSDRVFQLGGEIDVRNLYLSTVFVTARWAGSRRSICSGVLLSSGVVLTAGHCVCVPRQASALKDEGAALIDTSACAETAVLKMVTYEVLEPGMEEADSQVNVFRGSIRPHPELRVVLDARGHVASSHADLALIILDEPLKQGPRLVPVADTGVQLGESIVVVGYGYDETTGGHEQERRASKNRVTRVPAAGDERGAFEQPDGHLYKGDSGGPCLRESAKGLELVGISSRMLGEGATFTSIHPYRDWLRAQLP